MIKKPTFDFTNGVVDLYCILQLISQEHCQAHSGDDRVNFRQHLFRLLVVRPTQ